jgi:hypothetical protein
VRAGEKVHVQASELVNKSFIPMHKDGNMEMRMKNKNLFVVAF